MDISECVSADYETFDGDTRVAQLEGTFEETGVKTVVIVDDGEYEGVVTQQDVGGSNRKPNQKARGLVRQVARVSPTTDLREAARLMVGSDTDTLPVFEGDDLVGVVTAASMLAAVQQFFGVLPVADVSTSELVSVAPTTSLGEVLSIFRDERISHLPVLADGGVVGMVSLTDVLGFATREMARSQGGSPGAGARTGGGSPTRGGFGERAGDVERMLDLPVRNVATDRIRTTTPEESLDDAVGRMLSADVSSLVVTSDGDPTGIVTTTDLLGALTWREETQLPVQITNVRLLDDVTRADVADMIEDVVRKYAALSVYEANVHLHEHDEKLRGTPLLLARIRLFTDKGQFGEGYGAGHALRLARNVLERAVLEGKAESRPERLSSDEYYSKLYGWYLSGSARR